MIALNPDHDPAALAGEYARRGRMQIRDFFATAAAERIHADLRERTAWGVAYNVGDTVTQLTAQQAAALSPPEQARMLAGIHERARKGYQFLYNYYPLFSAYFTPGLPRHPLFDVYEFINSPAFLDFLRILTGEPGIRWADAQATLFRAGHFLKYHTDELPSDRRLAAYVLNFTPGWGRDWGGFLQFFNERYDVEEAYRPVFNALNIFTVPTDHSVNMVAAYAPGHRYSITGWLRGDAPPGPIGPGTRG